MKSNRVILSVAMILPAVFSLFISHALSVIDLPFFLIAGFSLSYALYRLMQKFKISKENSAKLVLACSIAGSSFLAYFLYYNHSAEGIYRRLVSSELPEGIEFLHREGYVPLAGGSEEIIFRLPPKGFTKMIKASGFEKSSLKDLEEFYPFWRSPNINDFGLKPFHVYRILTFPGSPSLSGIIIIANEEENLVFLHRWKI